MIDEFDVVWLTQQRRFAYLVSIGAYFSTVQYTIDGIVYEDQIENDEYELWKEHAIGYESE